ncbi:putative HVA22-like protein g [Bidens hawaiensis]|uniref:putative HVA22-like protein g n=1 Tax=Bidens hawaiensis TaxID=980011 RepID=UPI004049E66C
MLGDLITSSLMLVLGYAIPALECFKAIETQGVRNEELRFWCQYWVLVAILTVFERVGDMFISWIPMYGELKLALIIYLWYPSTRGTGFVYETMLRPFMVRHETDIETRLKQFRDRAWDVAIYYWQNSTELGQTKIFEIFQYLLSSKPSTTKPTPSQGLKNKEHPGDGRPPPPPVSPTPAMFGLEPNEGRWAPTAPPAPTGHHRHHGHAAENRYGVNPAQHEPTWLRFRRSMGL